MAFISGDRRTTANLSVGERTKHQGYKTRALPEGAFPQIRRICERGPPRKSLQFAIGGNNLSDQGEIVRQARKIHRPHTIGLPSCFSETASTMPMRQALRAVPPRPPAASRAAKS